MEALIVIALIVFLGWRIWPQVGAAVGIESDNTPLQPFEMRTLDGVTVTDSTLRGHVALINYWATWCGPCRVEMPGFQRIYEKYRGRGFTVLGVSTDAGGPSVVRPYLADRYALSNACTNDDDQDRIATFPDHVAYYQSAKRNHEANFLTANPVENPFGFGAYLDAASDRRMLLRTLVARLDERGHSTIVVDCTPPLVRDAGMNAVKVLVPGLQPLNCEHRLRTLGGERVVSVAQRLGYAPRRRTINELNPWPHPFW